VRQALKERLAPPVDVRREGARERGAVGVALERLVRELAEVEVDEVLAARRVRRELEAHAPALADAEVEPHDAALVASNRDERRAERIAQRVAEGRDEVRHGPRRTPRLGRAPLRLRARRPWALLRCASNSSASVAAMSRTVNTISHSGASGRGTKASLRK
jgi:hypothetical protein